MTTFNFKKGDRVLFNRNNDDERKELDGVIETVDYADPSTPYYVMTTYGGYWIEETDITSQIGDTQLDRIEAKLDAIIKHFGVPFEE
jgi:hypothetical protein